MYTFIAAGFATAVFYEVFYFYLTEYAVKHFTKKGFVTFNRATAILAPLLGILMYSKLWLLFFVFVFYPVYLLEYFGSRSDEPKKGAVICVLVWLLCVGLCFAAFSNIKEPAAVFSAVNGNEAKVYLLAGAFLSRLAAMCLFAAVGAPMFFDRIFESAGAALPYTFGCALACVKGIGFSFTSQCIMFIAGYTAMAVFIFQITG